MSLHLLVTFGGSTLNELSSGKMELCTLEGKGFKFYAKGEGKGIGLKQKVQVKVSGLTQKIKVKALGLTPKVSGLKQKVKVLSLIKTFKGKR